MLSKLVDVGPGRTSACGGGSDDGGSRLVMPDERGSTDETGRLGITLTGNCSQVSAKRRVVANQEIGGVPG